MKKLVFAVLIIATLVALIGADINRSDAPPIVRIPKKPCYGYTIIEFGKGIDCHGDTVKLVKVNGGQQLAVK
jgi:hypothetical protein